MKIRYLLLFLIAFTSFNCSDKKISEFDGKLNAYLADHLGLDAINQEQIIVVPVEMGCEFCVLKIVEFIRVLKVPPLTKVILTASDKALVNNFLQEKVLTDVNGLIVDDENFFFLNGLSFLNPVLFQKNDDDWIKTDLFPVNVEENLFDLFVSEDIEQTAHDFYNLEISGEIQKIDTLNDLNFIHIKSVKGFGKDSVYSLNKELVKSFDKKVFKGVILQKKANAFLYYTHIIEDSMSAVTKRNLPQFNL
jgi:hypothetical protein